MAPTTTQDKEGEASRPRRRRSQSHGSIRRVPNATPEKASRSRPRSVARSRRPPNATPENSEEASRSGSVAGSRGPRGGGLVRHLPNPTHEEGEETSRSESLVPEPSSQQDKRKRKRKAKEKCKKRKRARDQEQAHYSETSSATSSPLRWPLEPSQFIDPAIEDACTQLRSKFHKKSAGHCKLLTLDQTTTCSCIRDEKFLPVRDSVTQVVMKAGKAVLRLSSYIDGKPLSESSGFLIDWDKESKTATILTSALLIRSKAPSNEWTGTDEYIPDAKVLVHLLDKHETTVVAHLLHYDKHFNVALFKIDTDVSTQIPSFSTELEVRSGRFRAWKK